jgi:uncharacterized protein YndB with AHSA1/START domain
MADKEASVVRVHEIYIKATPAAIWDAITSPAWNGRYGYRAHADYDLKPGGKYAAKANEGMKKFGLPDVIIDGEVIESKPPHKLVQTWRWLFTEEQRKEGFSTLTYEIVDTGQGFSRLTVTHDQTHQPSMAAATISKFDVNSGGGGWNWILSDLKSLLETGKTMS